MEIELKKTGRVYDSKGHNYSTDLKKKNINLTLIKTNLNGIQKNVEH